MSTISERNRKKMSGKVTISDRVKANISRDVTRFTEGAVPASRYLYSASHKIASAFGHPEVAPYDPYENKDVGQTAVSAVADATNQVTMLSGGPQAILIKAALGGLLAKPTDKVLDAISRIIPEDIKSSKYSDMVSSYGLPVISILTSLKGIPSGAKNVYNIRENLKPNYGGPDVEANIKNMVKQNTERRTGIDVNKQLDSLSLDTQLRKDFADMVLLKNSEDIRNVSPGWNTSKDVPLKDIKLKENIPLIGGKSIPLSKLPDQPILGNIAEQANTHQELEDWINNEKYKRLISGGE